MPIRIIFLLLLAFLPSVDGAQKNSPNIVLINTDDLGYGDVGCYGAKNWQTPNIDRLARQGVKFTQFYVAQAVCSASRASLLTGCYPHKIGILGALGPESTNGVRNLTIAESLKEQGYATAIYGKWHLGRKPEFLPTRHGFDDYLGLPYSNDMWPEHPSTKFPDLPLLDGEKVVEYNPDQRKLTTVYTQLGVKFIENNRDKPFFLYVAHNMPHVPLFVSDKYKGKSKGGLYGDVIEEIDWSVGQILDALEKNGLDQQSVVIFTSDNGPWLSYGNHAGSSGGLREGKATVFEGGVRVLFIISWPGQIPREGVRNQPITSMDVFPTLAKLAGGVIPKEVDGKDLWPVIQSARGKSPHEAIYYYWNNKLEAVRMGDWKLHLAHSYPQPNPPGMDGKPGKMTIQQQPKALYNLVKDPAEATDVSAKNSKVLKQLEELAERAVAGK